MSGTNQGQPNGSGDFREYISGQSDLTTWNAIPADYVQILGAGSTVVKTEAGNSRTLTTDSIEPALVMKGPILQLVSTTATRVRIGYGTPPQTYPSASAASVAAASLAPVVAVAVANQATLTGLAQTIDGVALSTANKRVLLTLQTTAAQNGLWTVQSGAWTRPADWASGAAIPIGTQVAVAPGGTANFQAFGQTWYTDSGSVVDTDSIVLYPALCKGAATLNGASPSTVTVSSLWIKGTIASGATSLATANSTTAANGVKGVLTAGAGTGTLVLTGPNAAVDVISYDIDNA